MYRKGKSCNYTSLRHSYGFTTAQPRAGTKPGYIVPLYKPPAYDTLTHGTSPSCSGHFNIFTAYGKTPCQGDEKTKFAYVPPPCGN